MIRESLLRRDSRYTRTVIANQKKMEELITNRNIARFFMLIAAITAAIGIYYYNKNNESIQSERHKQVKQEIGDSKKDIIDKVEVSKGEVIEEVKNSKEEIIEKTETGNKEILENQKAGFKSIESKLPKKEKWKPSVNGVIQMGIRKAGKPKSFVTSGKPDKSKEREASWEEFKSKNNLEHNVIPLKISNHGTFPITDVTFKVIYDKPVFIIGEGRSNVPIQEVRNFPAFYDLQNSKPDEYNFLPFEWITNMFIYDNFHIAEIGPSKSLEFEVKRITDKLFLKKPKIEIRFKDHKGDIWEKINNEYRKVK